MGWFIWKDRTFLLLNSKPQTTNSSLRATPIKIGSYRYHPILIIDGFAICCWIDFYCPKFKKTPKALPRWRALPKLSSHCCDIKNHYSKKVTFNICSFRINFQVHRILHYNFPIGSAKTRSCLEKEKKVSKNEYVVNNSYFI